MSVAGQAVVFSKENWEKLARKGTRGKPAKSAGGVGFQKQAPFVVALFAKRVQVMVEVSFCERSTYIGARWKTG